MPTIDELLDAIFGDSQHTLADEFGAWVRASRRFKAFATANSTKIRAKLRNARDEARLQDVRAELATAALLLRDERIALEYEKYAALKQRGPDFTATFRTNAPFNVEVRRLRSLEVTDRDDEARAAKLMAVLCDKVGQMPPGIVNFLWLWTERDLTGDEMADAIKRLQQLAERKVEDYFTRRGFDSAADFLKHLRQLSGLVAQGPDARTVWLNPLARHKPPPDLVRAIERLGLP